MGGRLERESARQEAPQPDAPTYIFVLLISFEIDDADLFFFTRKNPVNGERVRSKSGSETESCCELGNIPSAGRYANH